MTRDIDYAAVAVRAAIVEKFGRTNDLNDLQVAAAEKTIEVRHGESSCAGTRDRLLAMVRKADSYQRFWQLAQEQPVSTP